SGDSFLLQIQGYIRRRVARGLDLALRRRRQQGAIRTRSERQANRAPGKSAAPGRGAGFAGCAEKGFSAPRGPQIVLFEQIQPRSPAWAFAHSGVVFCDRFERCLMSAVVWML